MKLDTFPDLESFVRQSVDVFWQACAHKGTIQIALSGGNTPQPVYRALAERSDIPFERIEFFQVDERYVRHDHQDSNYRMIHENLTSHVSDRLKEFYYFDTSLPMNEALNDYEHKLANIPDHVLELVVLGIGTDGHTASLFPGSTGAREEKRLVAHTITKEFSTQKRLTLTFPMLLRSKAILVLLEGRDKREVIKELKNPKKNSTLFPALKLLEHPNVTVHFWED